MAKHFASGTPSKSNQTGEGSHGEFAAELAAAEQVAGAAKSRKHAAALEAVEFDRTLLPQIADLAKKMRASLAELKKSRTANEKLRNLLLAALQPVQTAAQRRYLGDDQKLRQHYFVGESLNARSLPDLLAGAASMLARLAPGADGSEPADVLPGVKVEGRIRELREAIAKVREKAEAGKGGRTSTETLDALLNDASGLARLRRQIQLAADQAFPWRAKKVGAIRRSFLLPKDGPMQD